MLERLWRCKSEFVDGLRITDAKSVEVVEMVLSGTINKSIVSAINAAGGRAVGLSGKDGNLIQAKKLQRSVKDPESNIEKILDLGFVGEPHHGRSADPGLAAGLRPDPGDRAHRHRPPGRDLQHQRRYRRRRHRLGRRCLAPA